MALYWILLFLCGLFALVEHSRPPAARNMIDAPWILMMVVIACMIGLRWETGGDWYNYVEIINSHSWTGLDYALERSDPAFGLLAHFAANGGGGLTTVTMFSGIAMAVGLTVFCRNQPRPWLALTAAFPYMIVVLGMGYIRQGIALSFIMIGLVVLQRSSVLRYVLIITAGAAFHSSAALFVPIAALAQARNRLWTMIWVGISGGAAFFLFLREQADTFITNYVEAEYNSTGALVRVLMTVLAAGAFLLFRPRFQLDARERTLWTWLSVIALAFPVLLVVLPSSTAVDRIALYWLPLQLFVFSRLPDALAPDIKTQRLITLAIFIAYALTFYVWINFADNAFGWVPYKFKPLMETFY